MARYTTSAGAGTARCSIPGPGGPSSTNISEMNKDGYEFDPRHSILEAVVIPGTLLRDLVWESHESLHSVHVGVARRLAVIMDLVEQATYFRLDQRVASLILAGGSPINVGHQEIADDLGVSRENLSRVLGGFRDRGWLQLGRRRIETVHPQAAGLS